jgi:tetratricopeptide (TPR) repeat protein
MKSLPLLIAVSLLASAGCGLRRDVHRTRYLDEGKQHFERRSYREAAIAFRKALRNDNNCGECAYRLGLAELELKENLDRAALALRVAIQLQPDNDDAKVKLADLYLAAYLQDPDKPKLAYEETNRLAGLLLKKNPNSYDGLRLLAYLALIDDRVKEAVELFRKANSIRPLQTDLVLAFVQALARDNQLAEAERLALDLIQREKSFAPIYDVLYHQYVSSKRLADAENLLKLKATNKPRDMGALLQLAGHYFRTQKPAEMNAALQRIIENPGAFPNGRLAVGDFYRSIGYLDDALAHLQAGVQADAKLKDEYQKRIAAILLLQGKKEEAAKLYDSLVKDQPGDKASRTARAALLLEKDIDAALREFRALVDELPNNALLRYGLGRAYLAKGNVEAARASFREAIRRRRDYLAPRVALAEIALENGLYREAVQYADEILSYQPSHPEGRLFRGAGLTGVGQYLEARRELNNLVKEFPKFSDAHLQLALLDLAEKKYREAEVVFRKLYQPGSSDIRPLNGQVEVLLAQKKVDQAIQLLSGELRRFPNSMPIRLSLGRTAFRTGNYPLAIEQYRQLLAINAQASTLHAQLGEVQYRSGDFGGAIASFQRAKELAPQRQEITLFLAVALEGVGRKAEAIAHYRRTLEAAPGNAIALNNLAYLLCDNPATVEEAFKLARRALEVAPQQPNFADTLAWIYLKRNMPDPALQMLTSLVRKYPDSAPFRYHLGAVFLQKGDKARAKTELQAALGKKPTKEYEDRIRELMARIG